MRNKINIWKTVAATLLFTSSLHAKADEKLFQNWTFGTPLEQVASSESYYDCSEESGDSILCLDSTSFLGEEFEAAFGFNEDRLEKVVLVAPLSQPLQMKALGALNRSFALVSVEGETESFDILQQLKKPRNDINFQSQADDFETKQISNGYVSYVFIEQSFEKIRRYGDVFEAIRSSPINTRVVEVAAFDDEDGSWLTLTFTIPLLSQKVLAEQAEAAPYEEF